MTGNLAPLPSSDRDYLELLLYKLKVMKDRGAMYYSGKNETDKRYFDAAKKEVNDLIHILKKKGYDGSRYAPPKQQTLL